MSQPPALSWGHIQTRMLRMTSTVSNKHGLMPAKPRQVARNPRPLTLVLLLMVALVTWRGLCEKNAVIKPSKAADSRYVHYPEELFETDWSKQVLVSDQLDLGRLQASCMQFKDAVIPWDAEPPIHRNDSNLLERLKQCADVDIFIPGGIRNHGYCEDAAAYAKYLHGRLLPGWLQDFTVLDPSLGRVVHYVELCPRTPTIFFNHYYDNFLNEAIWPPTKKMILMPNLEMFELQAKQLRRPDLILCKTAICMRYVTRWFELYGNPRETRVIYTRHTSTDVSAIARSTLPANKIPPKNFQNVSFVHTAGTSGQKGTSRIFDCWLDRPDLPPVHVYMSEWLYTEGGFQQHYEHRLNTSTNVHLHIAKLSGVEFGHLFVNTSFFLCPSIQEGYGHYINQARAAGGLILTTDTSPMNELVTPTSGVLIRTHTVSDGHQFLGGTNQHPLALRRVPGFIADFGGKELCDAVDHVIDGMTAQERQRNATRSQQQYYFDLVFFARVMDELRQELSTQ